MFFNAVLERYFDVYKLEDLVNNSNLGGYPISEIRVKSIENNMRIKSPIFEAMS